MVVHSCLQAAAWRLTTLRFVSIEPVAMEERFTLMVAVPSSVAVDSIAMLRVVMVVQYLFAAGQSFFKTGQCSAPTLQPVEVTQCFLLTLTEASRTDCHALLVTGLLHREVRRTNWCQKGQQTSTIHMPAVLGIVAGTRSRVFRTAIERRAIESPG